MLTTPSEELLELLKELVGWLLDVNDEVDADSVLAGDSVSLAVQYERSQVRRLYEWNTFSVKDGQGSSQKFHLGVQLGGRTNE